MTQPTPKLPAPLALSGTIVAQMSAVQTTLNAVIAYLAAQPAAPDLGPLQKAVADLQTGLSTETETRADQYDAVMRECRKILDLPPVVFPDLAGLQKEAAAATAGIAELRKLVAELQTSDADDLELPDLAPLESRLTALEARKAPEVVDLEPLTARVAALEGQPAPAVPDTTLLEARIAQLEAALGLTAPVSATPLPDDLPGLAALKEDGRYTTLEAVQAATDEELDAVTGIGPATVQAIRAYTPSPDTEVTP